MALRDDPENRAGRREVLRSKTQKQGALSFGYFSLCTQRKVTRRRLRTRIQVLNSELKASSKRLNQAALLGQPLSTSL